MIHTPGKFKPQMVKVKIPKEIDGKRRELSSLLSLCHLHDTSLANETNAPHGSTGSIHASKFVGYAPHVSLAPSFACSVST